MKGIVIIEVEIDISATEKDSGLSQQEIAEYSAGGLCEAIKQQKLRSPKIKSCTIEYTQKVAVDF